LEIDGQLNRKRAVHTNGLWFEQGDLVKKEIQTGPRIGVNYAGEYWAKKPYRFWFSKPESTA
jgi:DNA-3-methyladenine glycosylase